MFPACYPRRLFPELASRAKSQVSAGEGMWGGWGSNPRPADYEKYGPTLWTRYLHGYHRAVPPMALIAQLARMARSTNRSTPHRGDHGLPATERYCRRVRYARAMAGGRRGRPGLLAVLRRSCRRRGTARPAGAADPAIRTGTTA